MSHRIPVTVVTGGQGSGKTALLNHWSDSEGLDGVVVLSHSLAGLRHRPARQINESVFVHEAGCMCCAVRGDVVQALQGLFMEALHRKTPVFSQVVIETSGRADPATFKYLVQYERFLADRYRFAGCLAVVDARCGGSTLAQIRRADALLLGKTGAASPSRHAQTRRLLRQLNPKAICHTWQSLPALAGLFDRAG